MIYSSSYSIYILGSEDINIKIILGQGHVDDLEVGVPRKDDYDCLKSLGIPGFIGY